MEKDKKGQKEKSAKMDLRHCCVVVLPPSQLEVLSRVLPTVQPHNCEPCKIFQFSTLALAVFSGLLKLNLASIASASLALSMASLAWASAVLLPTSSAIAASRAARAPSPNLF